VAALLGRSNLRVVITGASGWLGRATLAMLHAALGDAFQDRVFCFGSSARSIELLDLSVMQRPLRTIADLSSSPTLVLHCAFLTKDRAETMDVATYQTENRAICTQVLDALDTIGASAIFLPSSGAAFHADDPQASEAMRLYGSLKREDEEVFSAWAEKHGTTAAIARVFNLSGPFINKHNSYALASFIVDALAGRPIEVRARQHVVRSYVAIRELMSIVFAVLLGEQARVERFDTVGEDNVELRDLAQLVADAVGSGQVTASAVDPKLPANVYVGEGTRYKALARQFAIDPVPIGTQISETARYLLATTGQ